MTPPGPTGAWVSAVLVAAALLAGCGSGGDGGPDAGEVTEGDEPLTARALAAVVAEHTGAPSTAGPATDLEELGDGLGAGVDLRYAGDGGSGAYLLSVGVGRGFESELGEGCDSWRGRGVSGCEETGAGLLAWEVAVPEEDPGVVYVLVHKGRTDVLLFTSGPEITGDPRTLDLPVSVEDMVAVAEDPRVDLTTTREAVEAGQGLASWDAGPT